MDSAAVGRSGQEANPGPVPFIVLGNVRSGLSLIADITDIADLGIGLRRAFHRLSSIYLFNIPFILHP